MKGFVVPPMARPYDGPAVKNLMTQKSLLDAVQAMRSEQLAWEPASVEWFEDGLVRFVESSLSGHGEMFGEMRHPFVTGTRYFEAVWVREYLSLPTAVLIFFPYPGMTRIEPLVYTIGVYNRDWVERVVSTYAARIKEKAV